MCIFYTIWYILCIEKYFFCCTRWYIYVSIDTLPTKVSSFYFVFQNEPDRTYSRSYKPIKIFLKVHLQNSQWQRSHNDWTERPEASKENFGLDGRSSFKENYSLKEAPPVLKLYLILI